MKPVASAEVARVPPVIVIPAPDLELLECKMVPTRFTDIPGSLFCSLVGAVRNNSRHTFDAVSIKFNLYDGAGCLLDNASECVSNPEPGVTWRFRASYYAGVAAKWKPTELRGRREDGSGRYVFFSAQPAALVQDLTALTMLCKPGSHREPPWRPHSND